MHTKVKCLLDFVCIKTTVLRRIDKSFLSLFSAAVTTTTVTMTINAIGTSTFAASMIAICIAFCGQLLTSLARSFYRT